MPRYAEEKTQDKHGQTLFSSPLDRLISGLGRKLKKLVAWGISKSSAGSLYGKAKRSGCGSGYPRISSRDPGSLFAETSLSTVAICAVKPKSARERDNCENRDNPLRPRWDWKIETSATQKAVPLHDPHTGWSWMCELMLKHYLRSFNMWCIETTTWKSWIHCIFTYLHCIKSWTHLARRRMTYIYCTCMSCAHMYIYIYVRCTYKHVYYI